jgi:hypothetical protein
MHTETTKKMLSDCNRVKSDGPPYADETSLKYAGTDIGSWFTLEKARQLVNYSAGEMIYEYWHHPQHGPEPMHEVF